MIRPEMAGVVNVLDGISHSLTQTGFKVGKHQLMARWGLVPENSSPEPNVDVMKEPSWIMDLDMFSAEPVPFDTKSLLADSLTFMARIYAIFYWAVKEK